MKTAERILNEHLKKTRIAHSEDVFPCILEAMEEYSHLSPEKIRVLLTEAWNMGFERVYQDEFDKWLNSLNLSSPESEPKLTDEITAELNRAKAKHPVYPKSLFRQLAIMQEEAGEVTKAVLHFYYEDGTMDHIRQELIQTAAMCVRMLENLEKK